MQLTRDAMADIACLALVLAAMAGLDNYVKRWRTALHVTVSALIVAILGLAIPPVAHAAAVTATLSVASTWQTGFIAHFVPTHHRRIVCSTGNLFAPRGDCTLRLDHSETHQPQAA